MNEYKLMETGHVYRYSDRRVIPPNDENKDWREYMEYVDNGGYTDPVEVDE